MFFSHTITSAVAYPGAAATKAEWQCITQSRATKKWAGLYGATVPVPVDDPVGVFFPLHSFLLTPHRK